MWRTEFERQQVESIVTDPRDDSATAPGDVAWAAAGVLDPQGTSFGTEALWDPSRCQCLSVVRS